MKYLIGIDEAGRGPLAGPVSVGAVMVPMDFDFSLVEGVRDSKKLSEKKRETLFARFEELQDGGQLSFAVAFSSASIIDTRGIVFAIQSALSRCLQELRKDRPFCKKDGPFYEVLLDGGLKAPDEYLNQKTIIRGDDSEPVISMASIAAKVLRDRHMVEISSQYPTYGFDIHKGYGTLEHRRVLIREGLSSEHRATFCKNLRIKDKSL
ncbi:MAG: ribonuclease HII [Candidatus Paceibacterota bacterium]